MDRETYRRQRNLCDPGKLRRQLGHAGVIDNRGKLRVDAGSPFNVFARIAAGVMPNPLEQVVTSDQFIACANRPEADEQWASTDPAWVGRASMGQRHRFITVKDLRWDWFNILTVKDLPMLVRMEEYARACTAAWGWSDAIGLFFHAYPFNSVHSLHLHVVDLTTTGPTFDALAHKNLLLSDAMIVLARALDAPIAPPVATKQTVH